LVLLERERTIIDAYRGILPKVAGDGSLVQTGFLQSSSQLVNDDRLPAILPAYLEGGLGRAASTLETGANPITARVPVPRRDSKRSAACGATLRAIGDPVRANNAPRGCSGPVRLRKKGIRLCATKTKPDMHGCCAASPLARCSMQSSITVRRGALVRSCACV
jgi:hypothetical protein